MYHRMLHRGFIKKTEIESILNIDSRITAYNYVKEIEAFIAEFDFYLDEIIEIQYDAITKAYYLSAKIKK